MLFLFMLLTMVGHVAPVYAEEGGTGLSQYDGKEVKSIIKQSVNLMEKGHYKEAYSFLQMYYEQYKDDNDINFLLGQSSSMMGNQPQAIKYYEKILSKNPDLPRVRLELGRAYAVNGQGKEARREFQNVLASSPPPVVAEHVKKFLAQMDAQKNISIKLSLGYTYDTNVNAGPEDTIVNNGWQYESVKSSDYAITTGLQMDYFKTLSPTSAWQTGLQYHRTDYRHMSDSSWNEMNVYTGPLLQTSNATYSLPVNVKFTNVGGKRFSYAYGISPQAQYKLSGNKELLLSINAQSREFFTNENRNGFATSFAIAERFNLNKEKNKFVEVGVGLGNETAIDASLSNKNTSLYMMYYTPLAKGLSLLVRPSVTWYKYKGDDAYMQWFGSAIPRNETQYGVQVNLIKTQGSWNYVLGCVYTANKSNIDIYTYNRLLLSCQVSRYF